MLRSSDDSPGGSGLKKQPSESGGVRPESDGLNSLAVMGKSQGEGRVGISNLQDWSIAVVHPVAERYENPRTPPWSPSITTGKNNIR